MIQKLSPSSQTHSPGSRFGLLYHHGLSVVRSLSMDASQLTAFEGEVNAVLPAGAVAAYHHCPTDDNTGPEVLSVVVDTSGMSPAPSVAALAEHQCNLYLRARISGQNHGLNGHLLVLVR